MRKFPHTYVIVFYILLISAGLTWIIPGGEYTEEKIVVDGEERTERPVIHSFSHTWKLGVPCWLLDSEKPAAYGHEWRLLNREMARRQHLNDMK